MAVSLPKGINQVPSSNIKKEPNIKEITLIIILRPRNKGNLMFLDDIPTTIMKSSNTGNKKTASCLARWLLYSYK